MGKEITERICLEKPVFKANGEVESSNEANTQLLENKSHEIRTYMTRIISMTDLTLMTEVTEEQRDYLTIVKSSTKLLLKVLNDILDYSKIQAGKVDLEQVSFDIRATLDEVVNMFQVVAKQKNINVRFNSMDQRIPKNLIGDSVRLKQVLSNLIGNSVRFTNHGEVTVKVDLKEIVESRVCLQFIVSDTGVGIPQDKLVKLVKGFSQPDETKIRELGGTGLTISNRLVKLMGGDIEVDSMEGIGSKFCFSAVFGVLGEGGSYSSKQKL
ncbi:ATP-binding protein [Desulfosporosinus sp. OT]|uniref:sensor histidine kinase n=1 Tax=Desulfosporosinus sp. OT TaxID=913865 RepID=UPI000223A0B1|nr:ATP-binding protein [Desulfosporosinus sp. OT]EGW35989.1 his Kinase A domain protein [Desulfosporosinus sp. OT]